MAPPASSFLLPPASLLHKPMIGQLLDKRYKITQQLAQGGFGKTYLAQDTKRPGHPNCLVKQLHPRLRTQNYLQTAFRLFQQEAQILENLGQKHDRIPMLLAYLQEDGEFYLVEEFINGKTLRHELIEGQPWEEERAIQLLVDILEPLEVVHEHNVIHRDIKPDNLMRRTEDKRLVLIDFGAVKQVVSQESNSTIAIQTPGYAPPEQGKGKPEFSSDIYAVGILAIEALTGIPARQLPEDANTHEIVWQDKATVSPGLAMILEKMVRYNFDDRYPTAKEALAAVKDLLEPSMKTVRSQPPPTQNRPWTLMLLGIFGILAAVGVALFFIDKSGQELRLNGVAVEGSLEEGDRTYTDLAQQINTYADYYFIVGKAGETVTIEMTSDQFDTYLVLRDRHGKELAVNDDISPETSTARIEVTLPEEGKYTVIARSSESGESGNYKIWAVGD